MHTPVLLQQAIESLNIKKGGLYIDATFGEGGYSRAILERGGKVLGIDFDPKQISNFQFPISNLKLVEGNFADIEKIAKDNNFFPVDGIVFDLGLSMAQITDSGKGFSYKKDDEPLDMRMNDSIEKKASDLINSLNAEDLYQILARNSEELRSKEIALEIVKSRQVKKINIVSDLIRIIDRIVGEKDNRVYRRIFQALRIEVNDEFDNLKKGLFGAVSILKKDGRIIVVSFHSLEDRIVKNFVKNNQFKFLEKKPIVNKFGPSYERGAKLRIITL